jgi:hypothetical protein
MKHGRLPVKTCTTPLVETLKGVSPAQVQVLAQTMALPATKCKT